LTDQEILVFSILYQLEEETGFTDYKTIAQKLNLTESSIRDYIGRIIKKGIPVEKKRINNKNIRLTLSKNLKKIATLSTILQLRDL
jgi:predicted transcriptional regulator